MCPEVSQQFPQSPTPILSLEDALVPQAREKLVKIEAIAKEHFADCGLAGDDDFEAGALHDEALLLMDQGDYSAALAVLARLLVLRPHLPSAENNLSLIAAIETGLKEAIEIAEGTLSRNPNNFHALSNLVRFSVMSGETIKARLYADRLKAVDGSIPDTWTKKVEALSYLCDDAGILEVLSEAEKTMTPEIDSQQPISSLLYHFGAVSTLRLAPPGDEAAAKEARGPLGVG